MNKLIYFISGFCIVAGTIFFLHQESWIIINLPSQSKTLNTNHAHSVEYQEVPIYLWQHNKLTTELKQILKTETKIDAVHDLISQCLKLYQENNSINPLALIQSVIWSENQKLILISFNQTLFLKQSSTFEKLMLISGLLKTLKNTQPEIQRVQFLINHKPFSDPHLNFQMPWPVCTIDS